MSAMAELSPFGPSEGKDMGGIPGQKEPSVLRRLGDEAAHRRHAFLEDGSLLHCDAVARVESGAQLTPDAVVGPVVGAIVGRTP
jgi:hypothetical protein